MGAVTTPVRTSPARDRLLGTASRTFYGEGIRGVGVDRIVTEAGVTRATFYRHFPAKDDLVVADLDLGLLPLCTGRRWIRGRRPELYGSLTVPLGHEMSPQEARFSEAPTSAGRPAER